MSHSPFFVSICLFLFLFPSPITLASRLKDVLRIFVASQPSNSLSLCLSSLEAGQGSVGVVVCLVAQSFNLASKRESEKGREEGDTPLLCWASCSFFEWSSSTSGPKASLILSLSQTCYQEDSLIVHQTPLTLYVSGCVWEPVFHLKIKDALAYITAHEKQHETSFTR